MNENEITAAFAANVLETYGDRLASGLWQLGDKAKANLRIGFRKYVTAARKRYGKLKTFLYREKPVALEKFYVPALLRDSEQIVDDRRFLESLKIHNHVSVIGTAGSGKSVFLRHILMKYLSEKSRNIPILVELRNLNDEDQTILQYAASQIQSKIDYITQDVFEDLLSYGAIALLLDGYDEVNIEKREDFAKQIKGISNKFDGCIIIVTSRPDDLVDSWETFTSYTMMPLRKDQTIDLLNRLDYNKDVKSRFISEVDRELFDKHEDFLSNPLLTTMMLLTYEQFAEIPDKIHIFYQQAFLTLFTRHDAYKGLYKRQTYSGLAIDDFERVFSYFCATTYFPQKFTFDDSDVIEGLRSAISSFGVSSSPHLFLRDLLESVCLLQKDGLRYVFVHRSFQEYFTALFVTRLGLEQMRRAFESMVVRLRGDNVLPMAYSINPDVVEKGWVLPSLEDMCDTISSIDTNNDPVDYFSHFFSEISIGGDSISFVLSSDMTLGFRLLSIRRLYAGEINPYVNLDLDGDYRKFKEALRSNSSIRKEMKSLISPEQVERLLEDRSDGHYNFDFRKISTGMIDALSLRGRATYEKEALHRLLHRVRTQIGSREASFEEVFGGLSSKQQ